MFRGGVDLVEGQLHSILVDVIISQGHNLYKLKYLSLEPVNLKEKKGTFTVKGYFYFSLMKKKITVLSD